MVSGNVSAYIQTKQHRGTYNSNSYSIEGGGSENRSLSVIVKVTPNGLSSAVGALLGALLGARVGQTDSDGTCEGRALGAELTEGL